MGIETVGDRTEKWDRDCRRYNVGRKGIDLERC